MTEKLAYSAPAIEAIGSLEELTLLNKEAGGGDGINLIINGQSVPGKNDSV